MLNVFGRGADGDVMHKHAGAPTAIDPKVVADAAATARSLVGYSVDGAAAALGLPAAILEDVESGKTPLNAALRTRLEQCYGVNLDDVMRKRPDFTPRTPMAYDATRGVLRVGTLGVRFRIGLDSNDDLLRGLSTAIRRQRRLPPNVPLQLRAADIPVLAHLLDIEDPELDTRAQFWFGQTAQTAQGFASMLRIARAAGESAREETPSSMPHAA